MEIKVRQIEDTEFEIARELILRVFHEFEAPEYSIEGIQEFESYMDLFKMRERQIQNHFSLVAVKGGQIVGVIEIRNYSM